MHQAYNVNSIIKQGVLIESIAAYEDNVILGTRSGQLIMYSVKENGSVDMLMFNKNFSKKAITQMEVISSEKLLFVLTDGTIHVCDISRIESNFAFINSSPDTKGCSLFTLDVKIEKSTTGETSTVIRLCCAIKRRLNFFYWKLDSLCSPKFHIDLKDVPKALCWVNDIVCVGYKDEYVIFNIQSQKPEKHDLIVTSSSNNVDPCICLIKNNFIGVSKDAYLVPIDMIQYEKKKDEKTKMSSSHDNFGASTRSSNTLKPMTWSSPLLGLVWDAPYIIGHVTSGIEIRCLEGCSINKDTLVQRIPELAKCKFLVRADKGNIFAAATSELWWMNLADIPNQRQQLFQQKKFQLAIELTNISDEPEEIKSETVRQIHMRYAKELFANKTFYEAMGEFERAAADPYDVIRLFPNLLNDQNSKFAPEECHEMAFTYASVPLLEDKDLENALMALIEFLASSRQKEIAKLRKIKGTTKSSLLSIIDTTLLKCYLQTNDSLVAPLLRLNQCHLEESEKILKKHKKISELIILYQTNGKHKKALELLQTQSSIEGSSLYGHERSIRYLQSLGSAYIQLIFEFSDWILKTYPIDGLRIFTEDFIEVENLPRAAVLDHLLSKHKPCVIPYLEHVINLWKDTNTLLHNVLIKQYREKVEQLSLVLADDDNERKSVQSEEKEKYRTKLYNFLRSSKSYSPDSVLKDFPTNTLLAERALILGRLMQHAKVLAIYIQILGDVDTACEYCKSNYDTEKDIYLMLLQIILNPLSEPPYPGIAIHPSFLSPNHDVALQLLNKYALKINPAKILPFLPDNMPIDRLHNYVDTILRTQLARKHHNEILKGLLAGECKRLEEEVRKFEGDSITITEYTTCPACKKRFTNQSAFVRYPNGKIIHLSCHDRKVQP